jgi:hypothetical protein
MKVDILPREFYHLLRYCGGCISNHWFRGHSYNYCGAVVKNISSAIIAFISVILQEINL